MLTLPSSFITGVTSYRDAYYVNAQHSRIVILAEFEQTLLPAIVDTGAPWSIIGPGQAADAGIDVTAGIRASRPLNVRGIQYQGWICRLSVRLVAEKGQDLYLEPPVFIPEAAEWLAPNFIGLTGFLSNVRWAVDPGENLFYFGPL